MGLFQRRRPFSWNRRNHARPHLRFLHRLLQSFRGRSHVPLLHVSHVESPRRKGLFGRKYTGQELRLCSARHFRNIPREHKRYHRRHSRPRPKSVRGPSRRGRRPRRRPHRIRHVFRRPHERAAESMEFHSGDVRGRAGLYSPTHRFRTSQNTVHCVRLDQDCPVQSDCRLHRLQSPLLQYTKSKHGDLRPSFVHRRLLFLLIRLSLPRRKAWPHESSWGGTDCSCGESQ